MKNILMVATGGTIASVNSGAGLKPAISPEELLKNVPEIGQLCNVTLVQPFYLDSTNICREHWLILARIVEENYDKYDGFVITHGTDTMAYSAAALSYLIQNSPKPVVLTGAQKSMSLRDTDARKNLYDAFCYCVDDDAYGVRVVFDGNVILGTRAKKTRTRSFNAFSSVDFPEIAVVRDGKVVHYIKGTKPEKPTFFHALEGDVFVLKMIPGLQAEILDYVSEHYQAIVLETFGTGGLPDYENYAFFDRIKGFLKQGKTVVVTTQVEREGVALGKYEVGRRLLDCGRVLEARSMTLEATVSKLMWILAVTKDPEEIEKLFNAPVDQDIIE